MGFYHSILSSLGQLAMYKIIYVLSQSSIDKCSKYTICIYSDYRHELQENVDATSFSLPHHFISNICVA